MSLRTFRDACLFGTGIPFAGVLCFACRGVFWPFLISVGGTFVMGSIFLVADIALGRDR